MSQKPDPAWRWHAVCMPLAILALIAGPFFPVSWMFSVVWLALFIVGLFVLGKRGLWLLVGLPFAMFWPVAFGLLWGFGAKLVH